MTRILIVEDEVSFSDPLSYLLSKEGYEVSVAENGHDALTAFDTTGADLVLLDLMLPGLSGVDVCRALRQRSNVPVIMLTAKDSEIDKVVGLELGADDYVTKPYSSRELLARIKAVLRRAGESRVRAPDADTYGFGPWLLKSGERELIGEDNVAIPLSTGEYNLLHAFVTHPRRVLSRDQLLDLSQGRELAAFERSIDNHISRLRKKIESDPANPKLIKTVWGGGYMLAAEVKRL